MLYFFLDFGIFPASFLAGVWLRLSLVKVMEGNALECYVSIKKMKSVKAYRESQLTIIVITICGLLNSYGGGKFNIKFENDPMLPEEIDDVLRMIEQRLVDIIGSCTFYTKVMIQRSEVNNLDFFVSHSESLCTVDYKLYLPTQTQVIPISPCEAPEKVKAILDRVYCDHKSSSMVKEFVLDKDVPIKESKSTAFKQLKAEKSKCVSFVDRMTNKSNKLVRYISAFANNCGGNIYYGITNNSIVKGEYIMEKDHEQLVNKVTKTINQMIWCGGQLMRGKQWNIELVSVKDKINNNVPSLFIVIISVAQVRGGLFTQEPESYRVVHGKVERMPFTDWKHRLFDGVMVPSVVGRSQWSSAATQKICHHILQSLIKYQNEGNYAAFMKYDEQFNKQYHRNIEVQFVILVERTALSYKRGQFKQALLLLNKAKDQLLLVNEPVLTLRAVYARSAISRAKGDYQKSYEIAEKGIQLAEIGPAGIFTAWFYNHVAMLETFLSEQIKESEDSTLGMKARLKKSSQDHYIKALQHIQASSVEQEFSTTITDLQQRIHISRAISLLGNFANGANFRKVTPSDIKAAETGLINYHRLVVEGNLPTSYRKIHFLFAKSDLRLCQWWQQRQHQTQDERFLEDGEIPNFLKEAFDFVAKAKKLAIKLHFQELTGYACTRLAKITEIMIKLKISSLRLPRNINDNEQ